MLAEAIFKAPLERLTESYSHSCGIAVTPPTTPTYVNLCWVVGQLMVSGVTG